MNIGKACAIFEQINSDQFSDAEKLKAVREVVAMPTHNGITKNAMLNVLRWFAENVSADDEIVDKLSDVVYHGAALEMAKETIVQQKAEIDQLRESALADIEVVHGRWTFAGAYLNGAAKSWKCSACGGVSPKVFDFCPNCGAKMNVTAHDNADRCVCCGDVIPEGTDGVSGV